MDDLLRVSELLVGCSLFTLIPNGKGFGHVDFGRRYQHKDKRRLQRWHPPSQASCRKLTLRMNPMRAITEIELSS